MGQTAVQPALRVLCLLLVLGFAGHAMPALAATNLYCDPAIRAQLDRQAADAWNREQARISSSFPKPNDFNSMFCGAQITNMFNSINQSLVSTIFSQIRSLIDNLMRQACSLAVSPLQIAANALCIPAFNFSLNFSLPTANTGTCSGTPLFNVTPVYGSPYNYQSPTYQPFSIP